MSHVLKVMPRDIITQVWESDWGSFTKIWKDTVDLLAKGTAHTRMKVIGAKITVKTSATSDVCRLTKSLKGGRVMIAFFVNYSTVAFPLHLPTLKRQQFFGAVANSLGKNSNFPLPLDVRRYVAPTGEEVDARQREVN